MKRYIGKKMKADKKNVAKLTQLFLSMGINYCERCSSTTGLTFAHRMTRQHMRGNQKEYETVARICLKCHIEIEGKPDMKEIIDELIASRDFRMTLGA